MKFFFLCCSFWKREGEKSTKTARKSIDMEEHDKRMGKGKNSSNRVWKTLPLKLTS